jgi:hypothetical protein
MVPLAVQQSFSERRRLYALVLELRALRRRVDRFQRLLRSGNRELSGALQVEEAEAKGARFSRARTLDLLLFITSVTSDKAYSQHLQYLEAIKSSAKDLSQPIFEIAMDRSSYEVGPKPIYFM